MDSIGVVNGVIAVSALGTMVTVIYAVVKSRGTCPNHQSSFSRVYDETAKSAQAMSEKVNSDTQDIWKAIGDSEKARSSEMLAFGRELSAMREQIKALNDNMASFREYLKSVVDVLLKKITEKA